MMMREWFANLPQRQKSMVFFTSIGVVLATMFSTLFWISQPPKVAQPNGAWTAPGVRKDWPIRVWVDPETKCQYLVPTSGFSYQLTPRLNADGRIICDQPIPDDVNP